MNHRFRWTFLSSCLPPHSMTEAEYNLWGSGVSYAKQLLEGLDYEEFNITRFMPSLTIQVYAQSLFSSLFFFFFLFPCLSWLLIWEIVTRKTCCR